MALNRMDAITAYHGERAVLRLTRNVLPARSDTGSRHGLAADPRWRGRSGTGTPPRPTAFAVRVQRGPVEELHAAI
jgi:hypothetical protein